MDWVREFYTKTGTWWGPAEATVTDRDLRRVALLERFADTGPLRILELGCGYGTTAVAAAMAGHMVTGVELTDRAGFAQRLPVLAGEGVVRIVKDDFYEVNLDGQFDVVCYWNGFGIGSESDQRRLLRRISSEWLTGSGVALIDIANPFVWASWDGDEEAREPLPEKGYTYSLRERTTFDPVHNRAADTWWETDTPHQAFTQTIRCYTPADLRLLLEGTGLTLATIVVGDHTVDHEAPNQGLQSLLKEQHEYLAAMHHRQ